MRVSVRLEMVLILTQDRCTVCTERTTGPKIILDTPDRTPDVCTCMKHTTATCIAQSSWWIVRIVLVFGRIEFIYLLSTNSQKKKTYSPNSYVLLIL